MEITEKGYRNRSHCEWCGSVLAYSLKDVKCKVSSLRHENDVRLLRNLDPQIISFPKGTTFVFFIECPNCGFEIQSVRIPQSIKEGAESTISSS